MNKKQVRFMKRLESTLLCEFMKRTGLHEGMQEFQASGINYQRLLLGNSGY